MPSSSDTSSKPLVSFPFLFPPTSANSFPFPNSSVHQTLTYHAILLTSSYNTRLRKGSYESGWHLILFDRSR
ncbi:hypothetical protein CPC08DRAFT_47393 [Agrocybe pediades]|nr:hypothetical protein CPC08DRAFT_47393 [Agrocybe pediades]